MPRAPLWRNVLRFAGPVVLAVGVIVFAVVQFTGDRAADKPLPPAPDEQVACAADQKALTPEIERSPTSSSEPPSPERTWARRGR